MEAKRKILACAGYFVPIQSLSISTDWAIPAHPCYCTGNISTLIYKSGNKCSSRNLKHNPEGKKGALQRDAINSSLPQKGHLEINSEREAHAQAKN